MDKKTLSKEMDYQAAATEIATFQKALEEAYRAKKVQYDSTINSIVINFANRVMFERDIGAVPEAEIQATQT